ncbi:MAG TPA: hypothetical protein VMI75_17200 [Polyangiaceae bacterium]|nr:hypothetical protein [Polyangiaceae bacterium]
MSGAHEWWEDHRNLAALYRHLTDECELPEDQVAYFLEKPWKWTDEWERMIAGRPEPDEGELEPLLQASLAIAQAARRRKGE